MRPNNAINTDSKPRFKLVGAPQYIIQRGKHNRETYF